MKAYFINPPAANGVRIVREGRCMQRQGAWTAVWAPISLALLASLLKREGWETSLSDCIVQDIDFETLEKAVRDFQPDLVVINAVTPSLESDLLSCRTVKKAAPRAVTAAIGIHPTILPEECLALEPALDYVIRGEPELTVKELAAAIQNGTGPAGIAGLSYRSGNTVVREKDRVPLQNLDDLPLPAWHLVDRSKYILPFTDRPFLLIATSRGCPYSCTFCADAAFYGKKLRLRSPAKIVDELAWVKATFGISEFLFWSESFTINRQFCTAVAREIIARKLDVSWVCNSRVDHVDRELLDLFKKAGCWMIGYGIESGAQNIIDRMRKGITLEQIAAAVTASHAAGLEVTGHCVVGYPGETSATINQTIAMTKRLPFDFVQYYCSVPFPGSELYSEAKKEGWIVSNDWSRFEQNFSVITTPTLSADEVMAWRKRAYRRFYIRPRTVWNVLKKMKSFKDVLNLLKMAGDFLTWVK
jgi:radical SAM superfamily enzyme YgiQ (UPF0313 family)